MILRNYANKLVDLVPSFRYATARIHELWLTGNGRFAVDPEIEYMEWVSGRGLGELFGPPGELFGPTGERLGPLAGDRTFYQLL